MRVIRSAYMNDFLVELIIIMMIQFISINVTSQQPDGQLQRQHNMETQITQDNKQDTYQTNKTSKRILKSLITHYNNGLMIISNLTEYDDVHFQDILITTNTQN
jgi:hypothetical protein